MKIITNDGELFAVKGGHILSATVNHARRDWTFTDRELLSAVRLRNECRTGEIASIDGHKPVVRELIDLILIAESVMCNV